MQEKQVKVNTAIGAYRFNQKGQPIETITAPFVNVDAGNREGLEALYDPLHEHISTAFTYEGSRITGLSADYVNAIQNFLLVENAWYLTDLEDPSKDIKEDQPAATCSCEDGCHCPDAANGAPESNGTPTAEAEKAETEQIAAFIPDDAQRGIRMELEETAKRLQRITPDAADKWNTTLQRQLHAVMFFSTDNVNDACAQAKARIEKLKAAAKAAGIPDVVIDLNATAVNNPVGEEEIEEED
jgi:hypothetical protein